MSSYYHGVTGPEEVKEEEREAKMKKVKGAIKLLNKIEGENGKQNIKKKTYFCPVCDERYFFSSFIFFLNSKIFIFLCPFALPNIINIFMLNF